MLTRVRAAIADNFGVQTAQWMVGSFAATSTVVIPVRTPLAALSFGIGAVYSFFP